MSIAKHYNKTVNTQRLTAVSGSFKENWAASITGLLCHIQPSDGSEQLMGGAFFSGFKMFCASGTDLQVGDKVVDGTTEYTVKAVADFNFGKNSHIEAILQLGE